MKMHFALLLCLFFPAAIAGPLEDYTAARFAAGIHNAAVVHEELLARVPVPVTNLVNRATSEDEAALLALVVGPLVASNVWAATAMEDRAELVARRLDSRVLAADNNARQLDALILAAKVQALEARIVRRNGDPYGALAGVPSIPVVRETRGQVRWRFLGLSKAPTLSEVRSAMDPSRPRRPSAP